MVEYARNRVPSNVSLHVTDGLEIPLPEASADAIFSTHVLQHFSGLTAAATYFREMRRVLVPGGTVMIHVPIIAWPWGSLLRVHKLVHKAKTVLDSWHARLGRCAFICPPIISVIRLSDFGVGVRSFCEYERVLNGHF